LEFVASNALVLGAGAAAIIAVLAGNAFLAWFFSRRLAAHIGRVSAKGVRQVLTPLEGVSAKAIGEELRVVAAEVIDNNLANRLDAAGGEIQQVVRTADAEIRRDMSYGLKNINVEMSSGLDRIDREMSSRLEKFDREMSSRL
jgi:hypothetical protein